MWVRFPSGLETTLQPANGPDGPRLGARVRDVSRGGIGLLLQHRFRPGTRLTVDVRDRISAARPTLAVRVIHATAVLEGGMMT